MIFEGGLGLLFTKHTHDCVCVNLLTFHVRAAISPRSKLLSDAINSVLRYLSRHPIVVLLESASGENI